MSENDPLKDIINDNEEVSMFEQEGCGWCATAKDLLKDKIESGKVNILNISKSKDAFELALKHKVTSTPTFLVKNKKTEGIEVCELSKDGSRLLCPTREVKL